MLARMIARSDSWKRGRRLISFRMKPAAPSELTLSKRGGVGRVAQVRHLAARVDRGREDVAEERPRVVRVLRELAVGPRVANPADAAVAERDEEAEVDVAVPRQRRDALLPRLLRLAQALVQLVDAAPPASGPGPARRPALRRRPSRAATAPTTVPPARTRGGSDERHERSDRRRHRDRRRARTNLTLRRCGRGWGHCLSAFIDPPQVDDLFALRSSAMRKTSMHHVLQVEGDRRQLPVAPRMKRKRALRPGQHLAQRIDHLLEHRLGRAPRGGRGARAAASRRAPRRSRRRPCAGAASAASSACAADDPAARPASRPGGCTPGADALVTWPRTRRTIAGAAAGRDHERAGLVLQAQELEHLGQREGPDVAAEARQRRPARRSADGAARTSSAAAPRGSRRRRARAPPRAAARARASSCSPSADSASPRL